MNQHFIWFLFHGTYYQGGPIEIPDNFLKELSAMFTATRSFLLDRSKSGSSLENLSPTVLSFLVTALASQIIIDIVLELLVDMWEWK